MSRKRGILSTEDRDVMLRKLRSFNRSNKLPLLNAMKLHGENRYLFGYRIQQNAPSMWILECMLSAHRPDVIVELGTGFGMLATYFSVYGMLSDFDVNVISIDLTMPKLKDRIEAINQNKTRFLQMDIYDPKTVDFVAEKINSAKRPFILVDGVDPKSKEVNLYAPKLKEGVVMFAHDASLNGAKKVRWGFSEDKINWDYVEKNEPYYSWSVEGDTRMLCLKTISNKKVEQN